MKLKMVFIVISFAIMAGVSGALAADGIAELQSRIDAAGAEWQAGSSWVSELSVVEQKRLLGGTVPETRDESFSVHSTESPPMAGLPAVFDWRDNLGENWMTPVKNQANCGSCAAFASAGCIEAVIRIARNDAALDIDLSEQQIFSCCNGDCATGLYMGAAFNYFRDTGVVDEECLPYTQVDDNCDKLCSDWEERVETIESWELLCQYDMDSEALKAEVMEQPVACYLEVYGDFMSYKSGIYEHVTGNLMGGHFVVVVGWNEAENYWICKNSWGLGWGEDGYFRIRTGETLIGTWAMVPEYHASAPPTPTRTPEPVPTAIPDLGVVIDMPQTSFTSGDTFYLNVQVNNPGFAMENIPLFVFLDVGGEYFFWPSWKGSPAIDFRLIDAGTGSTVIAVFDPFEWPDVGETHGEAAFWGALLNPDFTDILGDHDRVMWTF